MASMASIKGLAPTPLIDAWSYRIGIVRTRWNPAVVDALVAGAKRRLQAMGVSTITEIEVRRFRARLDASPGAI